MEWHCANFLSPYNTFHFLKQQMRQNPEDNLFHNLYKLSFSFPSKSVSDCSSTPADPALALTSLYARTTKCLDMLNGFVINR
jgi:hypothetical protein